MVCVPVSDKGIALELGLSHEHLLTEAAEVTHRINAD